MIPLIGLQPGEVEEFWPHVRPFIEKAMARTGILKSYDPEYVFEKLKTFEFQCWIGHSNKQIKVVHITTIEVKPKRKILCIPFVGAVEGTIEDWIDHLEVFKEFAKAHGCTTVRGYGRKGWEKVLQPDDVRIEFDIEVSNENLH